MSDIAWTLDPAVLSSEYAKQLKRDSGILRGWVGRMASPDASGEYFTCLLYHWIAPEIAVLVRLKPHEEDNSWRGEAWVSHDITDISRESLDLSMHIQQASSPPTFSLHLNKNKEKMATILTSTPDFPDILSIAAYNVTVGLVLAVDSHLAKEKAELLLPHALGSLDFTKLTYSTNTMTLWGRWNGQRMRFNYETKGEITLLLGSETDGTKARLSVYSNTIHIHRSQPWPSYSPSDYLYISHLRQLHGIADDEPFCAFAAPWSEDELTAKKDKRLSICPLNKRETAILFALAADTLQKELAVKGMWKDEVTTYGFTGLYGEQVGVLRKSTAKLQGTTS